MSILTKLADKIQPKPEELAKVRKPPERSRFAVRVKPLAEVHPIAPEERPAQPQPVGTLIKLNRDRTYRFFTDGSLRLAGGRRYKGKAQRKALKRELRKQRELLSKRSPK